MPRLLLGLLLAVCVNKAALAQKAFTWQEVRDRFEATNPTLQAAQIAVDKSRAQQITAYLRPNPGYTTTLDQIAPFTSNPDFYRPFATALPLQSFNYLHERQHKRELRRDSARQATDIALSTLADQERTLLFTLRNAFVQTLQQKAILSAIGPGQQVVSDALVLQNTVEQE